ncbi:MAG: hypothetical protein O2884_12725 [Chloroflexi bacterium]|nr:hypothetical protein [Chloroflexota bacterium]
MTEDSRSDGDRIIGIAARALGPMLLIVALNLLGCGWVNSVDTGYSGDGYSWDFGLLFLYAIVFGGINLGAAVVALVLLIVAAKTHRMTTLHLGIAVLSGPPVSLLAVQAGVIPVATAAALVVSLLVVAKTRRMASLSSGIGLTAGPAVFVLIGLIAPITGLAQQSQYRSEPVIDPAEFSCANVEEIPLNECDALVAVFDAIEGRTNRPAFDWLTSNTPCDWLGVRCGAGYIATLDLSHTSIRGELPPELGGLSQLPASNFKPMD